MRYLHLDCLLQSDSKAKIFRGLVDTGFDGELLINSKTAEALRLVPDKNKVSKTILGDGKSVLTRIANLKFSIPKLNENLVIELTTIILPREIDCIIGTSLLETLCRSTGQNIILNYKNNCIEFSPF